MRCWAQHLRPDSTVWPCHTYNVWPSSGAPKIPLYCTEYNWPTTCTHPRCGSCPHGHTVLLVWQRERMGMQNQQWVTNPFQSKISSPKPGIVDGLPIWHRNDYARDFCTPDEGYYTGWVAATTQNWKPHWANWTKYVRPLGLDPFLQGVRYMTEVRVLTRFAARVRRGLYGWGKQVQTRMVIGALMAVGQEITLAWKKHVRLSFQSPFSFLFVRKQLK